MKDFLNQEINAGDVIVYPNRKRGSMWMNKATVTEKGDSALKIIRDDGQTKTLTRIDRIVVVTKQVS